MQNLVKIGKELLT